MGGDDAEFTAEMFTAEMLSMMAKDLQESKATLEEAYAHQDQSRLREELHRVLGALCYLRLPQLEKALKVFHRAVRVHPNDPKKWKITYANLQAAMEAFGKAWKS